jgi:hypothetical protein
MRAARAKAAAAKQNKNPAMLQTDTTEQNGLLDQAAGALPTTAKPNKKPSAAQPAAMNLNGQKTAPTPHSGQEGQ